MSVRFTDLELVLRTEIAPFGWARVDSGCQSQPEAKRDLSLVSSVP